MGALVGSVQCWLVPAVCGVCVCVWFGGPRQSGQQADLRDCSRVDENILFILRPHGLSSFFP